MGKRRFTGTMGLLMTTGEKEMAILKVLGTTRGSVFPIVDRRLGFGRAYLIECVNQNLGVDEKINSYEFMQLVWALTANGLCFIDFSQSAPENWTLELTTAGRSALEDESFIPDNVPAYLKKIAADIPDLSATANLYLSESLRSYTSRNYLAATMMLGVAAEAIFYESAEAFADWTPDRSGAKLKALLADPKISYIRKFDEFQKRLSPLKSSLPADFQQNLDLNINSILELLRLARNDVGHPTGLTVAHDNAFQYLVVFPMLAKRLYALRKHCISGTP